MATIHEFKTSREQQNQGGRTTAKRVFRVAYLPGVDATISPQQAETDLKNGAYAVQIGSAFPGDATMTCTAIETKFIDLGVYEIACKYSTYTDDAKRKPINTEEIEVDFSTETITEYYGGTSPGDGTGYTTALDGEKGQFGAPMLAPKLVIRVKRIQSSVNYSAIATAACHVNSGTYTTPGGTTLSSVQGDLLFVGCTTRKLDDEKYELNYTFVRDIMPITTGSGTVSNKHRVWIAQFDESTKKINTVTGYYLYPWSAFTGLMANE